MANRAEHHHVSILKGKKGEFDALGTLAPSVKSRVTPLVEIFTAPWDWDTDTPAKSMDSHVASAVQQLERGWGGDDVLWLDTLWLDPDEAVAGTSILERLFDLARDRVLGVPVGGPGRPPSHTAALAAVTAADGRGAVLRLDPEDLGDPSALIGAMDGWLQAVSVSPEDVDLLVDFSAITPALAPSVTLAASAVIPALPHLLRWRTFTLASGAFPSDLTGVKPQSVARLPRADWTLWRTVSQRQVPRVPAFGDYGIGHPELFDPDPRTIRPSATIRFTGDADWVIVKERWAQRYGFTQFRQASATLMGEAEYVSSQHCAGCEFIEACAQGGATGNLTTWRRVGTVHHLTQTASQLASLP